MMKLDKNYTIEKDKYSFTLKYAGEPYEKEVKGKMKTIIPKTEYYYPNLPLTLKAYIDKSIDIKGIESAKEMVDKLEEVYKKIERVLKNRVI